MGTDHERQAPLATIWIIFAILTGLAVLAVLWPLSRAPATTDARELDVAFYKAQTAEIERDTMRGVIGTDEAATARNEAALRLMAAQQRTTPDVARGSPWATRGVALATILFVPLSALGLYAYVGAPGIPDDPLQARLDAPASTMDLPTAIAKIEQHMTEHPDDGKGWSVLAPIYVRLGKFDDAARAYQNEIRLLGPDSNRFAALGEAEVFGGGGTVTAEAQAAFARSVALDPASPRANFYLGVAAQQDGDKPKALAIWTKLVASSPPDAPWLPTVRNHIAELSGAPMSPPGVDAASPGRGMPSGPMAAQVASMSGDKQQAFIHQMVDGLADRLKTNGNDIDGWLRLVRAYRVLQEPDKAKGALGDAKRNFAGDPAAVKRLDDLAHELGLQG